MSENEFPPSYEVGFKRPPKSSRFRKGMSGNPRGRPKGVPNVATVVKRTLQESVVIEENGVRKTVTKLEAAIKQLANRAASGDFAAIRMLTSLAQSLETEATDSEEKPRMTESDEKIMALLVQRIQGSRKETINEKS